MAPRAREKSKGLMGSGNAYLGKCGPSLWRLVYVSKSDLHVKIRTHGCGNPLLQAKFSVFYLPHAAD